MGYSNDLRVRVIQVVEGGEAARAAARQFVIGDSTAIRWAKRWRETGSFEAKTNKGRSRSPLRKHEEWLLGLVKQEPDLTLEEISAVCWRSINIRRAWFGLAVLRPPRHQLQKKAFARPSRIGLTSPRRGRHGLKISPSSIPSAWSSSTKPAPQPTWRDCAVGRRAANGWSAKSRTVTGKPPPLSRGCAQTRSPPRASSTAR